MQLAKKQTMIVMGDGAGCHEKRQFVRGKGFNEEHLYLTCMAVHVNRFTCLGVHSKKALA